MSRPWPNMSCEILADDNGSGEKDTSVYIQWEAGGGWLGD